MKFGRVYTMQAQGVYKLHIINFPLTCRFRITGYGLPSGSQAVFQIYNLAPETRRDLGKDFYELSIYRPIVFSAGYESDLPIPTIFKGNIQEAYSYRQGPDWITEITATDGGHAKTNSSFSASYKTPYVMNRILTDIVKSMANNNVSLGIISDSFGATNSRGTALSGNSWDLLVDSTKPFNVFPTINNEVVNIIAENEYLEANGTIDTIDADTGLLDSPRHQDNLLMCRMIFEPRLALQQLIDVDSIEPGNSGSWKVQAIDHRGTISGAVCESLNTEVTLYRTPEEFVLATHDNFAD